MHVFTLQSCVYFHRLQFAAGVKSVAVDKQKRQKFRDKQARKPGKFRNLDWSGHATSKGTGTSGRSADETGLDLGSGGR